MNYAFKVKLLDRIIDFFIHFFNNKNRDIIEGNKNN